MYNEEDMKDALKRFDWAAVQALLPNRDTPTLKKLLGDVSHSGCFIRLHPLKPAEDQRRSAMRTELRTLAATIAGVDAGKFVDFLLNQVDITEAALDVINENVDNDPYSGFDVPTQAWAALEWALLEMVDVHRQMHEGLQNSQENGTVFIDPLNLRVNSQNGSSLADQHAFANGCQYAPHVGTSQSLVKDWAVYLASEGRCWRGGIACSAADLATGRRLASDCR